MENKKESNQEQVDEIIKKILGDNMQVINIGKVNQQESKNLDWAKLGEVLKQAEKAMSEYITTKTEEKTLTKDKSVKNIPKTLKQIDEEMESNIGKKGKIKNHPFITNGIEVEIIGFSKELGKYIVKIDSISNAYADYDQVEIIEDKWKDIHINGTNACGFDEYSIIIQQDCIGIIGVQNIGAFNESKYTKMVEDEEIIEACIKNIKLNKEKVIDYLLNSLLRDKYYKEYHKVSDEFKKAKHNRTILIKNIENNTSVIKSLERGLGI